ncbi:uncharacterized protein LOC117100121 [Anneissia japonica]|uniref:uncharacterized protein LOC117100121 n=1 Tax=Anneissia japonica TaxID=1529436 RepID=UPI0014257844|nr:uncharacterized protein LOC117100121 [Anneissia japonica]
MNMNAFMYVIMIVGVFVLSSSFGVEVTVDVQPVNATEYQRTYLIYNYTRSLPTSVKSAYCRWHKVMSYEAMLIASINSEGNNVVEKFTNKIYFDEDGNLVFTNITRKDTGTYKCDVEIIDDLPYVNSDEVNVSVLCKYEYISTY